MLELRSRCPVVNGACTSQFAIDTSIPYCSPSPLPSYLTYLTTWTPEFLTPSPLWCKSPIPGRKVMHPFSAASKTWCSVLARATEMEMKNRMSSHRSPTGEVACVQGWLSWKMIRAKWMVQIKNWEKRGLLLPELFGGESHEWDLAL